jgi:hypothetical protein
MNAVVTMVTTSVVMRLSLNNGTLGLTSTIKAMFTPIVSKYINLIGSLCFTIVEALNLFVLVNKSSPPSRADTFWINVHTLLLLAALGLTAYCFGMIGRTKLNIGK